MKFFFVFLVYLFLGVFLVFSFKKVSQIINSQQLKTPLATSSFSLETAPSESLRGTIASLSGEVGWQSRTATDTAKITKPMQIQQGERIVTKDTGRAIIVFANTVTLAVNPKTEIDFIQTLPTNILIGQNSGTANYIKLNGNPLSIRSLDLLTKINQGDITVSISEAQPYIIIDVKSGLITVAYNDINYITQVINVTSGKRLIFRTDTKRVTLASIQ